MIARFIGALGAVGLLAVAACASPSQPAAPAGKPAAGPPTASAPAASAPTNAPADAPAASKPAAAPTAPPAPVTINYAHPVISSQFMHLFVGKEKGFFAQEGINLETVFVAAGNPAIAQGTVGGAYELSSQTGDVLVQSVEQSAPLVALAGENKTATFGIVVQPEIASFADIRGKDVTFGAASVRGGTSTVFRWILSQQGLRDGPDYSFVAAGSTSERVTALRNKVIAGGLMGQPQDFMMADDGFRVLGYTSDFLPDYAMATVGARRDWAQANAATVIRFLRAHIRSIHWMYDPANRAEWVNILAAATRTEPRYAERSYDLQIDRLKLWPVNGEITPVAIEGTLKVLSDEGELQGPMPPASKYYDTRYWEQAIADVGRR